MKLRKKLLYITEPPEGLFYIPKFVSAQEEQELLLDVSAQPFEPYNHLGYKANREVSYFGTENGYNGLDAESRAVPVPMWLEPLRARFADLIGLQSSELAEALVARYSVGAGIGWHRDRPQFGPSVFGLSLASEAEMRFRRYFDDREEIYKINLERGSAYIIGGPARSIWQHGMNPVKRLRYSITFRTIKNKLTDSTDIRHSPRQIAKQLSSSQFEDPVRRSDTNQVSQLKLSL